jgi:hypothetical protein
VRFPGTDATSFPGHRPAIFDVPPRNPHFTGRNELLDILHRRLSKTGAAAVVQAGAVYGLGGVGKTSAAVEYAHRYAADYDVVWWIRAERPVTITERLAQLGRRLGLPELPSWKSRSEWCSMHLGSKTVGYWSTTTPTSPPTCKGCGHQPVAATS